jgi:hypothetical protein
MVLYCFRFREKKNRGIKYSMEKKMTRREGKEGGADIVLSSVNVIGDNMRFVHGEAVLSHVTKAILTLTLLFVFFY